MKAVLVNGSRREKGCTNAALGIIAGVLHESGIGTELFFIGKKAASGEVDKVVKAVVEAMKTADALIVGSPVYFASPTGEIVSFLDRLFWTARDELRFKPGAAIVSARRGGTTATLDVLNKYFLISQMPIVSSCYWNIIHGNTPEEILQDEEGIQIMRTVGTNMAWLLKSIEAGKRSGILQPVAKERVLTNFIR